MKRIFQCCNASRIVLLIFGLWPYRQSTFTRFQIIFFYVILSAGIIIQLIPLIILKCTSELVIKVLSSVIFLLMCIIQYNLVTFNFGLIKNLLMMLQHVQNELKDENEIAIAKKYRNITKCHTVGFTALGILATFSIIIDQAWSNMVDVNLSKNISEPYYLLITEHFTYQQKYFYLIMLYTNVIICVGIFLMIGTGIMFINIVVNFCGMFRITSYRIKHSITIDILQNTTLKSKILMTDRIICAVDIHRRAMKLINYMLCTSIEMWFLCFTGCVVICFSFNMFQLLQIASSKNNVREFLLPLIFAGSSFIYLFIVNYYGQILTDHNNHIFVTAYSIQWYRAPLHIQKMILFLLQTGSKDFMLTIGGILDGSMETFATLVKASTSYFTVIYSTQS